jgi:peptide-N4-(N-acetyl-beta-glucosaminyl)asparagine amidase
MYNLLTVFLGWNRKIGYCIAFSHEGATDVTRRYARSFSHWSEERTRCSEATLLYIIDEIRTLRRKDMTKQEKFKLLGEDIQEEYKLSTIIAKTLVVELCRNLRNSSSQENLNSTAQKVAEAREAGMLKHLV